MLAQGLLKLAQICPATARAADSALTLHPCVTHAQKQKWTLYEVSFCVNVSRYIEDEFERGPERYLGVLPTNSP
jgi:hypothetical protein